MKVFCVYFGMMIVMLGIWVEVGTAQDPPPDPSTWMPDANLRAAVLARLKLFDIVDDNATTFTQANMADSRFISLFEFVDEKITDLTGLEYATSLTELTLNSNSISDISVVSDLINLTRLYLNGNSISNISAVSGLTNLTRLNLSNNRISDISAVSGLTQLEWLFLSSNNISDISAVSGLTNLTNLSLGFNRISDISAVSGLTSLTYLYLGGNSISDISAVSGLTSLTYLYLTRNRIRSTDELLGLTKLQRLTLDRNRITDVKEFLKLADLPSLTHFQCEPDTPNSLQHVKDGNEDALQDCLHVPTTPPTPPSTLSTPPKDPSAPPLTVTFEDYPEDKPIDEFTLTIKFSEPVIGFEADDITVETELTRGKGTATLTDLTPTTGDPNIGDLTSDPAPLAGLTTLPEAEQTYTATLELPKRAAGSVRLIVRADAAITPLELIGPEADTPSEPIEFQGHQPLRPATCGLGWAPGYHFHVIPKVMIYALEFEYNPDRNAGYTCKAIEIRTGDDSIDNLTGWKLYLGGLYNPAHVPIEIPEAHAQVSDRTLRLTLEMLGLETFRCNTVSLPSQPLPGVHYVLKTDKNIIVDTAYSCFIYGQSAFIEKDHIWEKSPRQVSSKALRTMDTPRIERYITKSNSIYVTYIDIEDFGWDRPVLSDWLLPEIPGGTAGSDDSLAGRITFSEVMYATRSGGLPSPWIELYNTSAEIVDLEGWQLRIETRDHQPVHWHTTVTFNSFAVMPNQTVLVVTRSDRSSGNIPERQIYNAKRQNRRALLLSDEGFALRLFSPDGTLVDRVGNLDGRMTQEKPRWALPSGWTETGARTSLIRRYEDGVPLQGNLSRSWVRASETALIGPYTYFGHREDHGTPGYRRGSPLPVTLSSVRADLSEGSVFVKWTTASEMENAGFYVLRSREKGSGFLRVSPALIPGAGTTSEGQTYTYRDTMVQLNVPYYYRLEEVSLSGERRAVATVRLRGHVSAANKVFWKWADLKK